MKKFVFKLFLFFVLCFVMDQFFDFSARYLFDHAKSGSTEKNKYISDKTNEDILIFGSSRGVHHYDPQIIEDSLKMTCYNCAYDGCGIITAYGLLVALLEHYTPRVIIYDVMPVFDYLESGSNNKYLGPLKLIYDKNGIDSIFINISPNEKWKMMSYMYRINSKLIVLLSENLMVRNQTIKGYLPRNEQMYYEPNIKEHEEKIVYDKIKVFYLKRFISTCKNKGIKLVFFVSPSYKKTDDYQFKYIYKLAQHEGIPCISHYCDTSFVKNKNLFYDSVHMNQKGATEYTKMIISELKQILNSN